jgi:hypothetical protein
MYNLDQWEKCDKAHADRKIIRTARRSIQIALLWELSLNGHRKQDSRRDIAEKNHSEQAECRSTEGIARCAWLSEVRAGKQNDSVDTEAGEDRRNLGMITSY